MRGQVKIALIHLHLLGAVDSAQLTDLGHQMAKLPLEPPQARCLAASFQNDCAADMIDILALLEHSDTLLINTVATRERAQEVRRRFLHRDGDHMFLLNILRSYQSLLDESRPKGANKSELKAWCQEHLINHKSMAGVLKSRQQLRERCKRLGLDWAKSADSQTSHQDNREGDSEPILSSLLSGFPCNTAVQQPDKSYLNPVTKVVRHYIHFRYNDPAWKTSLTYVVHRSVKHVHGTASQNTPFFLFTEQRN